MNLFSRKIKKFYTFVESPRLDKTAIKIIKGPFSGIIYTYGRCGFKEIETGKLTARFEYTIIECPYETYNARKFEKLAGDILIDLVTDQVNDGTLAKSLEKEIELDDRRPDSEGND